jgi:hypothetical protein
LGYTISTYGTEGLAQMFIGTNSSDRSEEGQAIVTLFDRFMSGKRLIIDKTYSIYRYIN